MEREAKAELGAFLRRARARLTPGEVGLELAPGAAERRRTPGLRRQEVAQIAGISVDYYIRLEQGRGARPSEQVLSALGRALRLSGAERTYLLGLTGAAAHVPERLVREVRPGLLRILDQLHDAPAMVCDAAFGVLAWNPLAAALLPDLLGDPAPIVAWRYFNGDRSHRDPADTAAFARELVADLRVTASRYRSDPAVAGLIARLLAHSSEFADLWAAHEVERSRTTTKRIHHRDEGWIELDCEALHDPERDQWVILYTAAPQSPGRLALDRLRTTVTDPSVETAGGRLAPGRGEA